MPFFRTLWTWWIRKPSGVVPIDRFKDEHLYEQRMRPRKRFVARGQAELVRWPRATAPTARS